MWIPLLILALKVAEMIFSDSGDSGPDDDNNVDGNDGGE